MVASEPKTYKKVVCKIFSGVTDSQNMRRCSQHYSTTFTGVKTRKTIRRQQAFQRWGFDSSKKLELKIPRRAVVLLHDYL
ncbi:MAG: hypothetical protein QXT61_03560 [Candidatus Caldarchaeum sp.]